MKNSFVNKKTSKQHYEENNCVNVLSILVLDNFDFLIHDVKLYIQLVVGINRFLRKW